MNILSNLLVKELDHEAETGRKMLSRITDDKYHWQPHPKSMTIEQLATHLAEIPGWIKLAITTEDLDFNNTDGYKRAEVSNTAAALAAFEASYQQSRPLLADVSDDLLLNGTWTMRGGEQIYATLSKYETIRHALAQLIHHRAQLGVYLRLLDIAIPGSYGPSADEMGMNF